MGNRHIVNSFGLLQSTPISNWIKSMKSKPIEFVVRKGFQLFKKSMEVGWKYKVSMMAMIVTVHNQHKNSFSGLFKEQWGVIDGHINSILQQFQLSHLDVLTPSRPSLTDENYFPTCSSSWETRSNIQIVCCCGNTKLPTYITITESITLHHCFNFPHYTITLWLSTCRSQNELEPSQVHSQTTSG